jgi:hypothetical protein
MKLIFTERTIVVLLFIMVLVTFSFAQNETKKMEHLYSGGHLSIQKFAAPKLEAKTNVPVTLKRSAIIE